MNSFCVPDYSNMYVFPYLCRRSNYYQETDMGRKEEYKLQNEQFMQTLRTEADVH